MSTLKTIRRLSGAVCVAPLDCTGQPMAKPLVFDWHACNMQTVMDSPLSPSVINTNREKGALTPPDTVSLYQPHEKQYHHWGVRASPAAFHNPQQAGDPG